MSKRVGVFVVKEQERKCRVTKNIGKRSQLNTEIRFAYYFVFVLVDMNIFSNDDQREQTHFVSLLSDLTGHEVNICNIHRLIFRSS